MKRHLYTGRQCYLQMVELRRFLLSECSLWDLSCWDFSSWPYAWEVSVVPGCLKRFCIFWVKNSEYFLLSQFPKLCYLNPLTLLTSALFDLLFLEDIFMFTTVGLSISSRTFDRITFDKLKKLIYSKQNTIKSQQFLVNIFIKWVQIHWVYKSFEKVLLLIWSCQLEYVVKMKSHYFLVHICRVVFCVCVCVCGFPLNTWSGFFTEKQTKIYL